MAVFAPLLVPESELDVTKATGTPFSPPSAEFPLGTDESGRSVLALTIWGAGVAAGRGPLLGDLGGDRLGGRHRRRPLRPLDRLGPDAGHRLVPGHPVPALAIVLATVLGPSLANIAFVIGISWPGTARIVRARPWP